jgi:protein-disulfide isomerase/uncharacterized membrane protein
MTEKIRKWLKELSINVSLNYLKHQLECHPDYPSMVSITDTLDELGIANAALTLDKRKLDEVPIPFLAFSSINGEGFIIVKNIKEQLQQNLGFEKNWNGVALLAEKPEHWHHAENESHLLKERKSRYHIALTIAMIILFAIIYLFNYFSSQLISLFLSSLIGFAIATLIVQHDLGISNDLTEQLCRTGKNIDCDAVMHAKGSGFSKWFNFADTGIIYFSSFFMLLVSLSPGLLILAVLSAAATPFIFYSLYYQWRVVRKWCPLCLIIVAILSMQFIIVLPVLMEFDFTTIGIREIVLTVFIIAVSASVWFLMLKPTLNRNKDLIDKNVSLQRFKNSLDIFTAALKQQRRADTTPLENDLQLGNAAAPIQIMVACNPYCSPCAKAHKALEELITKHDIGLTVRFAIRSAEKENKGTQAVEYMLQLLTNETIIYKRKALHEWYVDMNIEKFREKYPLHEQTEVVSLLKQHELWSKEMQIVFTPTIFINGYELPKQYNVENLKQLLRGWKNKEETIENKQLEHYEYAVV